VSGTVHQRTWQSDPALYAPPTYRRACRYDAFVPDAIADLDVSLSGTLTGVISDAESAILQLNNLAHPALRPFARLLLRTESIASSKVEGLQVDARSLARAEADGPGRAVGSQVSEILSNIDAMEMAIERAALTSAISPADLITIHGSLLSSVRTDIAGRVRTVQNWIGGNDYNPCGATFIPPPPECLSALLDDLCDFCNRDDLPPLVQAALAHAQFETIHPFEDGNGRTGRALIHIILRRRGLARDFVPPMSVVLARHRDAYLDGLISFRGADPSSWIEQFAVAAARSAQLASRYLDEVISLQDAWREELRASARLRADAAAWAVIDELPGLPVVTVATAVAATKRSKSAVSVAFEQLEGAGILVPLSANRRNRAWESAGLLDLLAGLESGQGVGEP